MRRMTVTGTIDTEKVQLNIIAMALGGLRRTAQFTLARAKYHAPVRQLFGDRSRRPSVPKGRNVEGWEKKGWRYIRSEAQYQAVIRSQPRRFGMAKGRDLDTQAALEAMRNTQSGGMLPRRIHEDWGSSHMASGAGVAGRASTRSGGTYASRFSGHANTLFPVLRDTVGTKVTGDLRRWGGTPEFIQQMKGKPSRLVSKRILPVKMMNAAGRYEYNDKSVGNLPRALFRGRIGGRLRGEIVVEGPEASMNEYWMYVVSPTPYAEPQEFGSAHNKAHPYLRPALYESRNVLRQEIRKSFKSPTSDAVYRGDNRPSSSKRLVN